MRDCMPAQASMHGQSATHLTHTCKCTYPVPRAPAHTHTHTATFLLCVPLAHSCVQRCPWARPSMPHMRGQQAARSQQPQRSQQQSCRRTPARVWCTPRPRPGAVARGGGQGERQSQVMTLESLGGGASCLRAKWYPPEPVCVMPRCILISQS